MFDLTTRDIKYISGVGPQKAGVLNKELEIYSVHDLIYYFPYKYVDRSRIYYIHEIDGNMPYIQLKGQILGFETFGEGRQRRLVAHFSDGTGVVDLVWFQGIKFILGKYKVHEEYIVFGKPTVFGGRINVAHPDIDKTAELKLTATGLQPYYNTTEKMKRSFLNSHAIAKMMATVLQQIQEPLPETLSSKILADHHLMPLTDALQNIHFPVNPEFLRKAQYRLKFEELFYVQLNILRYSKDRQRRYRGFYSRFRRRLFPPKTSLQSVLLCSGFPHYIPHPPSASQQGLQSGRSPPAPSASSEAKHGETGQRCREAAPSEAGPIWQAPTREAFFSFSAAKSYFSSTEIFFDYKPSFLCCQSNLKNKKKQAKIHVRGEKNAKLQTDALL